MLSQLRTPISLSNVHVGSVDSNILLYGTVLSQATSRVDSSSDGASSVDDSIERSFRREEITVLPAAEDEYNQQDCEL